MLSTSEKEIKQRLLSARTSSRTLTQIEKAQAKKFIKQGYSKKSVRLVFGCSYNDLK